jgi:tRNA(Ile)-lysidine synthase
MKLLRGAWTEGLSGIHPVVLVPNAAGLGRILRPLLSVRRADLIAFLKSRNQPWRIDSTNNDEAFTRNRIRHAVLPVLRKENPAIDQALANLAELAREDEVRWQSELSRILPQLLLPGRPVRGGGRAVSTAPGESGVVALEIDRLRALDPALRRRVLRAAARQLGVRLTFDETARLLALAGLLANPDSTSRNAAVGARTGSTLHLAGQLRVTRFPRELRLFRETPPKDPKSIDPL